MTQPKWLRGYIVLTLAWTPCRSYSFSSQEQSHADTEMRRISVNGNGKGSLVGWQICQPKSLPVNDNINQTRYSLEVVSINCGERCTRWLNELIEKWKCSITLLYYHNCPRSQPQNRRKLIKSLSSGNRSQATYHCNMLLVLSCGVLPDTQVWLLCQYSKKYSSHFHSIMMPKQPVVKITPADLSQWWVMVMT